MTYSGESEITAALYALADPTTPIVADLPLTLTRNWHDPISDPGAASISFDNTDPDLASVLHQLLIGFSYRGQRAFTMICEQAHRTLVDPTEDVAEITVWSGRGMLAATERGDIYASWGAGSKPVQQDRVFDFALPEYDDSAWSAPNILGDINAARAKEASIRGWPDGSGSIVGFPDWSASWVSSFGATQDLADPGNWFYRQTYGGPIVTQLHTFFFAWDDFGKAYIDGVEVASSTQRSFMQVQKVTLLLSPGPHVIAMSCTNGPPLEPWNPTGIAWSCYTAIDDTHLDAGPIAHSDVTGKTLSYPAAYPGMTPGAVVEIAILEMQARGVLPALTYSFTATHDSNGNLWPTPFPVISTKVGNNLLSFLTELAATYVDFHMPPDALRLDMTIKGQMGISTAVVFDVPSNPDDETTGNLTAFTQDETG